MWAISESFKKVKSPIIMLFLKASIVSQHLTVRCQYMVNSGLQVLVMDGKVFAQRFTCVSGYLVHMHVEQSLTRTNKSPCSHALKGALRSNSMVGGWTYSSHAFLSGYAVDVLPSLVDTPASGPGWPDYAGSTYGIRLVRPAGANCHAHGHEI